TRIKKACFNTRPCIPHHHQSNIAAIRLITTQQKNQLHHTRSLFQNASCAHCRLAHRLELRLRPVPFTSALGQSGCSNQNGALNLELLTSTNCYSNGGSAPMSCGNQGGDPSGSGILGGLLGSGAILNVNALNTVNCYSSK
ncbi:hypothetical protein PSTT_05908, partial [Puccinia striiformis]